MPQPAQLLLTGMSSAASGLKERSNTCMYTSLGLNGDDWPDETHVTANWFELSTVITGEVCTPPRLPALTWNSTPILAPVALACWKRMAEPVVQSTRNRPSGSAVTCGCESTLGVFDDQTVSQQSFVAAAAVGVVVLVSLCV